MGLGEVSNEVKGQGNKSWIRLSASPESYKESLEERLENIGHKLYMQSHSCSIASPRPLMTCAEGTGCSLLHFSQNM